MTCRCFQENQLFIISKKPVTFSNAKTKCKSIPGGQLLVADHGEKFSSCCKMDEENKQFFWTGLTLNTSCENNYSYMLDNGQNECVQHLPFSVRSTEDTNESCVSLALELPKRPGRSFETEQRACNKTAGYVCSIGIQKIIPTSQSRDQTSYYNRITTQDTTLENKVNHTTEPNGTTVQDFTNLEKINAGGLQNIQFKAIAGGAAGLLLLIIIALIAFQYRRRKKQNKRRGQSEIEILQMTETPSASPIYNEIEREPNWKDVQEKGDKKLPELSQYSYAACNPVFRNELEVCEDHEYVVIKSQVPRFPASKQQLPSSSSNGTNNYVNLFPSTSATTFQSENQYLDPLPLLKPK